MKSKDIADKILERIRREKSIRQPAIGRADLLFSDQPAAETFWIIRTLRQLATRLVRDFRGEIIDTVAGPDPYLDEEGTIVVSRDSKFGGSLITATIGKNKLLNEHNKLLETDVLTLAKYNPVPHWGDASQGVISTPEDTIKFANSLLEELRKLGELEEEVEHIQEEIEDKRKTEEERTLLRERLERKRTELKKQQEKVKKFHVRSNQLRGQAILDPEQEEIKRSKIFEGGLIIDGGPGTGKTTALIQRITFLTSPTILEYKPDLSESDQKFLFDERTGWIFFSPSELLREYLRNAMDQEGLSADKSKVVVWDRYRSILFRECGLINPATNRPFQASPARHPVFRGGGLETKKLIVDLEEFHFQRQRLKIERMLNVNIESFEWRTLGLTIRQAVQGYASFDNYGKWINLYGRLFSDFRDRALDISKTFRQEVQELAENTQLKVKKAEDLTSILNEELRIRFEKKAAPESEDEETDIDDIEEEEESPEGGMKYDFDVEVGKLLRRLIRLVALSQLDRNTKLSRKAREDYNRIESLVDKSAFRSIGEGALFVKYFQKLTRGVESNILRELPTSYKGFRRTVLLNSDLIAEEGKKTLESYVANENRRIAADEMDLLLVAVFRAIHALYDADRSLYNSSPNPLIATFRTHTKAVVAIDEATDFPALQLACMAYLSHPGFSSYTLSGDLMQRLNKNGLGSWDEFVVLFREAEKRKIRVSYRQTPTLLEIAREIYKRQLGVEADFTSDSQADDSDPLPLFFRSTIFEDKVNWITERIVEIHQIYGKSIPSIAVFFKDDTEMLKYAKALERHESLLELDIRVTACANGNVLGDAETVRLFAVQYIKGMEFQVVFFVDIDSIAVEHPDMVDKFVYVGLSRASLYLAVTVEKEFPSSLAYLQAMFSKSNTWLI